MLTISPSKGSPPSGADSDLTADNAHHNLRADPVSMLAAVSRQSATTDDPQSFAREAAQAAAEAIGASHCGTTEILTGGNVLGVSIRPTSGRHPSDGLKQFEVELERPDSLTALALREGRTMVVGDLELSEHEDSDLQRLAFPAAIVAPMFSDTYIYGALAAYSLSPCDFHPQQVALVEAVAATVTSSLTRCRAIAEAQRTGRLVQSLSTSMEAMMLVLAPQGTIHEANRACADITGFAPQELQGRSVWNALMLPEEVDAAKRAIGRLQQGEKSEHFETFILTRGGERRRIAWSVATLPSGPHEAGSVVATGIDITDRCEAVERAVRAETMAQDARRMCNDLKERIRSSEHVLSDNQLGASRLPRGIDYDRRAKTRREYPYIQQIAPLRGRDLPDESEFAEMKCRDISSRGFSFYSPRRPDYDKIVVAFGAGATRVFLTADVRHVTPKDVDGRKQYLIGCRYTGRISKTSADS